MTAVVAPQLKERLTTDAFVARAHFQNEFQALLREALPHVVTEEDRAGLMAPHVAGSPLPVGEPFHPQRSKMGPSGTPSPRSHPCADARCPPQAPSRSCSR